MKHRGCGGVIVEDGERGYDYDANDDGVTSQVPGYFCDMCGVEILGDAQIDLPDDYPC